MQLIFFVSDGTGITAETLGYALTTQFSDIHFTSSTLAYIDSTEKAQETLNTIRNAAAENSTKPIVFMTVVNPLVRECLANAEAHVFDLFGTYLEPLEKVLKTPSQDTIGQTHSMKPNTYDTRMNAVNYALNTDDGLSPRHYHQADVILVGVSRSGKTPTSLYLALQYGIYAANYPLTEEDLKQHKLPTSLVPFKEKLFGLTIEPERLQSIRSERRADSRYASLAQCRLETQEAMHIFQVGKVPYLDSTHHSIEELATKLLGSLKLSRRVY